jgi:hypothetical protein
MKDLVQTEIRAALSLLTPKKVVGATKVRIGRQYDGGYVMIKNFPAAPLCYSFGIGNDQSWDFGMAALGSKVYQYDHSIEPPAFHHPNCHFHRIGLAPDDSVSNLRRMDSLVLQNGHADQQDMILKVDIEGSEWASFDALPLGWFKRFGQIVMELHWLDHLHDEQFRSLYNRVMGNIIRTHQCVHIHGNNFGGYPVIHGVPIPQTVEVCLVEKSKNQFIDNDELFPGSLDTPNNINVPDLYLGLFRF